MKSLFRRSNYLALVAVLMFLLNAPTTASALKIAPDFNINDKQRLSDLKGKVVYLDFWASWCGPCRKSFPWMNNLAKKYAKQDFVVISVNLDSETAQAKQFLARYPAEFSVTFNPTGDIAEQYQVVGMPSSYLIDRNGRIAATHVGFFSKQTSKYEKQIDQLLSPHSNMDSLGTE